MTSKEELGKIKKLIFIMGEILVTESKQDISPEEAIQRIRKTCNKYGVNRTDYETIKQDLDRLEKLEKVIEILKQHSSIEFLEYSEYEDFKCFPVAIKEYKEEECDYTIINVGSKENYNLLKEILL